MIESLEELGELNTASGVLLTCGCSCCVLLHQLAHTMPVTVKAEKRIKAMLCIDCYALYDTLILRAYQTSRAEHMQRAAEARGGRMASGARGLRAEPCRTASGMEQRW